MSDWTTARVVRDRDGDLWGAPNHPALSGRWNRIGVAPLKMKAAWGDELAAAYGPLTPVLDADGLPVVRTVGDLTARHIGRRVQIPDPDLSGRMTLVGVRESAMGAGWALVLLETVHGRGSLAFPLDTPIEVLP